MRIAANKVVTIDYTVTTDQGAIVVSSSETEPMAYIQGIGDMLPALEAALEGKVAGDRVSAVVPPDQGYGERDESLVGAVPKDRFDPAVEPKAGMRFEVPSTGDAQVVTVVGVEGDNVIIDGNHPLAGIQLHFDVAVVAVRDASHEEMEHRHVQGPGHEHE